MKPQAKVIKAVKFEDGTYTIHSAPAPFVPTDVHGHGLHLSLALGELPSVFGG